MAALLLALPLAGRGSLVCWRRLMMRMRWLMLTLIVILGWSVAGEPLWAPGFVPPPSVEGLQDAMTQLLRLSLVLAAVAILVSTTPLPVLMAGCRSLLLPLSVLGLNVDRAVVRLSLVLQLSESAPQTGWRDWLATPPEEVTMRRVELPSPEPVWQDRLALAASAVLLGMAYLA
jgi:energy-coupling factor transporter transmembrane protein EcfT